MRRSAALLAFALATGPAYAAAVSNPVGVALPQDDQARHRYLHRDAAAPAPSLEDLLGTGGGGSGGGGNGGELDLDRLARYIASTTDRSYGRTFPDAFRILESGAQAVLGQFGSDLPPGVWIALEAGLRGGRQAARSEDAWGILHTYMRRVGDQMASFAGSDTAGVFDRLLKTARDASYERLFPSARRCLQAFFRALARRACDLGCPEGISLILRAAPRATRYAARDEDGWRALHTVIVELEQRGDKEELPLILEVAVDGSIGLLFESAYRFLQVFTEHLLNSGLIADAFDRLELQTALDNSQLGTWPERYTLLRDALNALR